MKTTVKTIGTSKQAMLHAAGAVVLMFAQWLISVILVRLDGYETAGIFSLAMSISNVFSAFAFYNWRNFRVTDIEEEFEQGQYISASLTTILISAIVFSIYIITATGYSNVERLSITMYLLYNYCNCVVETLYAYVQVKGRLELNGYSNIIRGTFLFLGFIGGFLVTRKLPVALAFMVISNAIVIVLFDLPAYRKVTGENVVLSKNEWRRIIELLRKCFPMMLAIILPIIVTAIPRRTIQNILGAEMLGYFSSIFTITVLITTVAPNVVNAMLPKIATLWNEKDKRKLVLEITKYYLGLSLFVVVALLAAALFGRLALELVFGKDILDYFNLLYLSIIVSGLYSMTMIGNGMLTTMRAGNIEMIAIIADFIIAVLLSNMAVSTFGIYGGAYLLIIAHLVQTVIQIIGMIRTISRKAF